MFNKKESRTETKSEKSQEHHRRRMEVERAVVIGGGASRYALKPARIKSEDILICVDVDAESTVEMKTTGTNGRPLIRMECVKQAIILFIHNKLSINPDHRFAFATLSKSAAWLKKEFTSDAESAVASLRGLSATKSSGRADLTLLFRAAAHEAKNSRAQNRILRVILIYCRSSVRPTHDWPINQKLFTLDVMYIHDKPGPDNCPQDVYDSLVDAVEHVSEYEGYIFESGQGLARSVFKPMSILLAHPQQRCAQDDLDIPKSLAKKVPVVDAASGEDHYNGNNVQTISQ
uniref:BRISC and BRCA1-A complex member 1 n=2 Tax=Noccaea caerulescens TaxID=107243 RepID=A0A1J3G1T5_NOCCA